MFQANVYGDSLQQGESKLEKGNYVSWSDYHLSSWPLQSDVPALRPLLLFNEKAVSMEIVKHCQSSNNTGIYDGRIN